MRIRTLKPEFWTHPVLIRLESATRLLAIALLNYADDDGYFYADEDLIRGSLMPKETSTNIRRSIDELAEIQWIHIVEHPTHGPIGYIDNFRKHQRIDRPKKSTIKDLYNSTKDRRTLEEKAAQEQGNREQGNKGKEGSEGEEAAPPPPPLFDPLDFSKLKFPTHLDTADFRGIWLKWLQSLQEAKKRLPTATAQTLHLEALSPLTAGHARATVAQSAAQAWAQFFPEKVDTTQLPQPKAVVPQLEPIAEPDRWRLIWPTYYPGLPPETWAELPRQDQEYLLKKLKSDTAA